jgi:hypothetical protein
MTFLRKHARKLAPIPVVAVLLGLSVQPGIAAGERAALAARFHFVRTALPAVPGPQHLVRPVNPSLAGISAWISSVGASVAFADLSESGLAQDVCSVDTRTNQVVIAPVPGTGDRYAPFALAPGPDLSDPATMAPMGCLPGDLDEDGLQDITVYYWGRTPIVFLQLPRPAGTPLSAASFRGQAVLPGAERWYSNTATLADLDGSGHLDLVVGNYFADGARILDANANVSDHMQNSMARGSNGAGARLLRLVGARGGADPSVTFADDSAAIPEAARHGWTLAVGAADLTGDLLPDLYLANDFGPDRLLVNTSRPGHLGFRLAQGVKNLTTPSSKVLGHDSFKGMGVDFGDLYGRGLTDIVVSNITSSYALEESNFVFVNSGHTADLSRGVAPFDDRSQELGLAQSGWSWDVKLADFDNRGSLEMVQAVGFVRGTVNRWPELQELAMGNPELLSDPRFWPNFTAGTDLSGHESDRFYVRAADGRYYDVGGQLGLAQPGPSRGIAVADVFGDGRLSMAIANQMATSYLYRNDSAGAGRFLGLNLLLPVGAGPSGTEVVDGHPAYTGQARPAIGAEVRVRLPDGRVVLDRVDGGNGHSGRRSPQIHVGLGDVPAGTPLAVEMSWRAADGSPRRANLELTPGWHTVMLGLEAPR